MAIILLIAYAVIMTILFICALIGVSTRIQDDACIIRNDRIVVKDFISQLTEAQGRVSALEAENCKLKEVISQQDKDLDTCHKLLELQNQANSQLSTLNSQLGEALQLSTLNSQLGELGEALQLSTLNSQLGELGEALQLSTPPEVPGVQSQIS